MYQALKPRLLLLDDDEAMRGQMRWAFCRDYEVLEAGTRAEAMRSGTEEVPIGIIDLGLPPSPFEPVEGMRAIREILSANPLFKAVVVTGLDEREDAFRALDLGAFDYFTKPASMDEIRVTLKRAMYAYEQESANLGAGALWPSDMVGVSMPMRGVFHTIRKLAEVNLPALITGEPGTGRETAARAIHRLSARHAKPFTPVDCALTPPEALEARLFGISAERRRKCLFEHSDGGTMFLREIGSLNLRLQGRLLKLLQEYAIEDPFTGERASVDVRVISSTSMDLKSMVRGGEFREDLYSRLGVVSLDLPPLRKRGEDIYLLSLYFTKKYSRDSGSPAARLSRPCTEAIERYRWPGNVRELKNRIKRAVLLSSGPEISAADLGIPCPAPGPAPLSSGLSDARDAFRKKMIGEALARSNGSVSRAAFELGISRQYLSKLISKYNLRPS